MTDHGRLVSLTSTVVGDEFAQALAVLGTTCYLTDVSDFDEAGGKVLINGNAYTYTAVDMDLETITLSTAITAAAGDRVDLIDPDTGKVSLVYSALVTLDDQTDGDAIEADLHHSLVPLLAQGVRPIGESVTLDHDGTGYTVSKIHGKQGSMDADTVLAGSLQTGPTGTRVEISATPGQQARISFYPGGANDALPGMLDVDTTGFTQYALKAISPTTTAAGTPAQLVLYPGATAAAASAQVTAGTTQFSGNVQTLAGDIGTLGGNISTQPVAGSYGVITGGVIHSNAGGIFLDDLAIGGSLTGASIGAGGRIQRTVSSARYKDDIEPMSLDEARRVLDLEPVTFRLKEEADDPDRRTYPGFIAEQAADVGAELWVNRDAEGRPDGFRYDELTAALLLLVRDQGERIAALEQAVAGL